MPFYMHQWTLSQPAVKALVDNPQNREDAARKVVEGLGGTLHQFFFTFGHYDGLAIAEYPDDETAAAVAMAVSAAGTASRMETTKLLRATDAMSAMQRVKGASTGYTAPQG